MVKPHLQEPPPCDGKLKKPVCKKQTGNVSHNNLKYMLDSPTRPPASTAAMLAHGGGERLDRCETAEAIIG
jgi:hypothetical protein